jgi:two-component system, NtrC family, sensor kinase
MESVGSAVIPNLPKNLSTEETPITAPVEELLQREREAHKKLIEQLEEAHHQLLQSEKMASIGQLAAGVAHEINNPVGFVQSNIGVLRSYMEAALAIITHFEELNEGNLPPSVIELYRHYDFSYLRDDAQSVLTETEEGVQRVRQIVQDLKDFSHTDAGEWGWIDLHKGLDSTLNIVNNEIKYKATVEREYGKLPEVQCIAPQLNQVFLNLLVNASDAIIDQGTIHVRTGCSGDQVFVQIADSGAGIAPEILRRIFDPFFTTKPVGKGTGLGLSLSYGIVQKHHGRIDVQSIIGKGTTFTVFLPIKQPVEEVPGQEAA